MFELIRSIRVPDISRTCVKHKYSDDNEGCSPLVYRVIIPLSKAQPLGDQHAELQTKHMDMVSVTEIRCELLI